jgi:hypothetical protein
MEEGACCICGKGSKLSFEHVPPAAAFTDKKVFEAASARARPCLDYTERRMRV